MIRHVRLFIEYKKLYPVMQACVKDMEDGVLDVDAVNINGETFGVVFCWKNTDWQEKYWLRYWALKPSPEIFWTAFVTNWSEWRECSFQKAALSRIIHISALWEDLPFLCNLVTVHSSRLARLLPELLPELDRRVSASLRFAWIAAVAL